MGYMIKEKKKFLLFFTILLGILLRLYLLNKENPSLDEIATIFHSFTFAPFKDILSLSKYWFSVGHFPTYFIMMHYWMKLFGISEAAVRFPSVVFGVLSIWLVFLLAKRLFDEKIGLLAGYLFAVSMININYSQCGRPYSMSTCFVVLSFLTLLVALERNTLKPWLGYIAATLLALLLSASTLPILICQIAFLGLSWPRYKGVIKPSRLIAVFGLILLVYLPILSMVVLPNLDKGKIVPIAWISKPSLCKIIHIFNIFGGKIFVDEMEHSTTVNSNLVKIPTNLFGIILFLLCIAGMLVSYKSYKKGADNQRGDNPTAWPFLSLWLLLPIILPLIFSYIVSPVLGEVRYLLYISIPYYILISKGIFSFPKKARISLIILIALMGSAFLYEYYHSEKRTNWRQMYNYIQKNIKADEEAAFIVNNSSHFSHVEYGMLKNRLFSIIGIKIKESSIVMPKGFEQYTKETKLIKKYAPEELNYRGIWLVTWTPPGLEKLHKDTIEKIKNKYDLVESITADKRLSFVAVTLYHFRLKKVSDR